MKNLLMILFLLLFVIIQTAMASFLGIGQVEPNLVLIFVLALVILLGFKKIWWFVLAAGLILDLFSGLPFGLVSFCFVSVSFLIDWLNQNVFSIIKLWIHSGLIGLIILIYDLLLVVLSRLLLSINLAFSVKYWLLDILYNFLIAFIFLYGAKKIFYQKQGTRNS